MRIYLVTANAQDHNEYIEYRDQPYNPDSFTDTPMHMGETSCTAGFVKLPEDNIRELTDTSVTISTLETSITGFLEHVDDIRHIIPSRDFFTISKTSMGYVPTVYYQCFIEPDDSCSETDKLLHLKVRIKPDVAHNGRIARLYPEESEQAAIDDANRAIGRLRTILGRC